MSIQWRIDNPPEEEKDYLVTYTNGSRAICKWTKRNPIGCGESSEWWWINDLYCKVKAWMELPAPYDDTVDRITDYLENTEEDKLPMNVYKDIWTIINKEDKK